MVEYSFKLAPYCTIRICLVLKKDHNNNYGYKFKTKLKRKYNNIFI